MSGANPINRLKKKVQRLKRILSIFYRSFKGQHPVVVYQMGKVGSTTIYETIKQLKKNPVFHVHILRKKEIQLCQKVYEAANTKIEYKHIVHSKTISPLVNKRWGIEWNIITAVRDPLDTKLSHLFQNPRVFYKDLFDENGKINKERALSITSKWIHDFNPETDFICNWFDTEFKSYLGIDLYNYPFDKTNGYQIIRHNGNNILVIQMDVINSSLSKALREMKITATDIEVKTANESLNKEFSEIYRYVKDNLVVSDEVLKKIYDTKYANHFFSSEFIRRKIDQWTKKRLISTR